LILPRLFTNQELNALDGEEEPDDGEWTTKDEIYEGPTIGV